MPIGMDAGMVIGGPQTTQETTRMGKAVQERLWPPRSMQVFFQLVTLSFVIIVSLGSSAFAQPPIHITFDGDEEGRTPVGWISRNGSPEGVYTVKAEGTKKFLHADARRTGVQLGREKKWSPKELPVIEWNWRPVLFPLSSDERKKASDDSVLAVYVLFGRPPFVSAIKYVWSDTLPVGMCFDSPFYGKTKMLIVENGRSSSGKWTTERRDILADYHRLFGNGEAPEATGIAVLTDSDNTNSHSIGDYGDITITASDSASSAQKISPSSFRLPGSSNHHRARTRSTKTSIFWT
jgi:hypothetical protein